MSLALKLLVALVLSIAMPRALSALEFFPGTLGSKLFIESAFSRVDESVDHGFDRFDNSVREVRSHVEAILASARAELGDAMDLFFDELTTQQKLAAAAYLSALHETEESYRRAVETGSDFVLDTVQLVAALSPLGVSPVVTGMTTLKPLYDDTVGTVTVVVTGINIGHASNAAYGPMGKFKSARISDNRIEFDIEVDMASMEMDEIPVTIEIFEKAMMWQDKKRRLPLTLRAIPNLIGEVAAVYTTETVAPRTRTVPPEGQEPFRRGCSGGGFSRCRNVINERIAPTADHEIVADSIVPVATFSNRCASRKGFRREARNVSPNGFILHVSARSSKGRSCHITGRVTFDEVPRAGAISEHVTAFQPFRYSAGGTSFELPQGARLIGYRFRETADGPEIPLAVNSSLRMLRTVSSPESTIVELVPTLGSR